MADQTVAANGSGEVVLLQGDVHAFFVTDGVAATLIYPLPGAGSVSFVGKAGPKVQATLTALANETLPA